MIFTNQHHPNEFNNKIEQNKTLITVETRSCEVWPKLLILVQCLVLPSFSIRTPLGELGT